MSNMGRRTAGVLVAWIGVLVFSAVAADPQTESKEAQNKARMQKIDDMGVARSRLVAKMQPMMDGLAGKGTRQWREQDLQFRRSVDTAVGEMNDRIQKEQAKPEQERDVGFAKWIADRETLQTKWNKLNEHNSKSKWQEMNQLYNQSLIPLYNSSTTLDGLWLRLDMDAALLKDAYGEIEKFINEGWPAINREWDVEHAKLKAEVETAIKKANVLPVTVLAADTALPEAKPAVAEDAGKKDPKVEALDAAVGKFYAAYTEALMFQTNGLPTFQWKGGKNGENWNKGWQVLNEAMQKEQAKPEAEKDAAKFKRLKEMAWGAQAKWQKYSENDQFIADDVNYEGQLVGITRQLCDQFGWWHDPWRKMKMNPDALIPMYEAMTKYLSERSIEQ